MWLPSVNMLISSKPYDSIMPIATLRTRYTMQIIYMYTLCKIIVTTLPMSVCLSPPPLGL